VGLFFIEGDRTLNSNKFFRKLDWVAGWITFAIALGLYAYTVQPTVGLEDSGELIVASDYLGVPHSPGYPIWTFFTWLFQWIFHGVTFHGHPNPAWAVNLFSGVTGALACGIMTMLISRSGMDLLRTMKKESQILGEKTEQLFCSISGITGGLLLAFSHGMWSQAVIAEVYTFNILFQALVLLFLYRWFAEKPQNNKWLFLSVFTFGLGIANHQTLMFMGPAIAAAIFLKDIKMFSFKYLLPILLLLASFVLLVGGMYFNLISVLFVGTVGCITACLLIRKPFLSKDFIVVGVLLIFIIFSFRALEAQANEITDTISKLFKKGAINTVLEKSAWQHILFNSQWDKGPSSLGFWLLSFGIVGAPILLAIRLKAKNIAIITAFFALLFIGFNVVDFHQAKIHQQLLEKAAEAPLSPKENEQFKNSSYKNRTQIFQQEVFLQKRPNNDILIVPKTSSPKELQQAIKYTFKGFKNPFFNIALAYLFMIPALLFLKLPNGRVVSAAVLLAFLGLSFYLFMSFSSEQNPPINWAYPRTWKGFIHAITRGQYEQVKLASVFDPRFLKQLKVYLLDLSSQFYQGIAAVGILPLIFFPFLRIKSKNRFALNNKITGLDFFFWNTLWLLPFALFLLFLSNFATWILILGTLLALIPFLYPALLRVNDMEKNKAWAFLTLLPPFSLALVTFLITTFDPNPNIKYLLIAYFLIIFICTLLFYLSPEGFSKISLIPNKNETSTEEENDNEENDSHLASHWLFSTFVAFLVVGILLVIIQNPKPDIQSLFIGQVQYIQSHAIYMLWISYGLLLLITWLQSLTKNSPLKWIMITLMLLLPFSLIYKNKTDQEQQKIYGKIGQRGHDFGWQYGNGQLEGVRGIKEYLKANYSPEEFEKIWATYPNKNYPQPMETNAIFFGGTDPGRFVPTYMIYAAHVRPDIYLITQNALADDTYMKTMRDLYGDQIWIPSDHDATIEFSKFIQDVEAGRVKIKDGGLKKINGRWQLKSQLGVMKINALDCKIIFNNNQYRTETKTDEATRPKGSAVVYEDPKIDPKTGHPPQRAFYIEESFPLAWMYPYLTPHGLIMQLNNKPTKLTPEMIKNDTDFWNWYTKHLVSDKKYTQDIPAQKSFCKLRLSIAGLYFARHHNKEAEAAYRQALELYPLSSEANFKYAQFLAQKAQYKKACQLIEKYLEEDSNNKTAQALFQHLTLIYINQLISTKKMDQAIPLAKKLLAINDKEMNPGFILQLAKIMAQAKRYDFVEKALLKFVKIQPKSPQGWINLAGFYLFQKKIDKMWESIDKALELSKKPVQQLLRKDPQFNPIRNTLEFKKRVPPLPAQKTVTPPYFKY